MRHPHKRVIATRIGRSLVALATIAALPSAIAVQPALADGPPAYLNARLPVAKRVGDLLGRMTLEEKVGQMTQAERGAIDGDRDQITKLALGSVRPGGGSVPADNTPAGWADMVDAYQSKALATRLKIPLLYGIDSVHGHNNLVGATIFPHNIGMGATRDPRLVKREEEITAIETKASGPQWVFAPCVCVSRDLRWGRTYESFGEDPRLVSEMAVGIEGFQGKHKRDMATNRHVLATAKHFAGDGDTVFGSSTSGTYTIDQGVTVTDRKTFAKIDLAPYVTAVKRYDVGSIMPSFSSVEWTEDGVGNPVKMSAHKELLTDVLKGRSASTGSSSATGRPSSRSPATTPRRCGRPSTPHGHVHGALQRSAVRRDADRRGEGGTREDVAHRRRRPPHSDGEVRARPVRAPVHRPQPRQDDRVAGAPRGRA